MANTVLMEKRGAVVTLTLNRPDSFNALTYELADELAEVTNSLARDDSARAIVITGAGKAFCAGGDLKWVSEFEGGNHRAFHKLAGRFHAAALEIRRMKKPVIAAVGGVAAGAGFTLTLACDFRVMAKSARLVQAYTSVGLSIDGGGTWALPRMVGMARALEIAAFDEPINSDKALDWGLVTKVVDDGKALEDAFAMAQDLAARSVHSFGLSKRLINDSFQSAFESHVDREREGIADCGAHPDGKEGIKAFLEKRKPKFK